MAMALSPSRADRATVMAALAARRLDRTFTTALPAFDPTDDTAVGATTLAAFDAALGGLPRGQLSELVGPASSGRTSLLLHLCAAATARGELVALVDALDQFDLESAVAAGLDLERLLWIRGMVAPDPRACRDANRRAMEQAVKALSLVLQAGNFGLVAFDIAGAPADTLGHLPFTTWLRVQRMVEGTQTQCVLVAAQPVARSAAGLTVMMHSRSAEAACERQGASLGVARPRSVHDRGASHIPAPIRESVGALRVARSNTPASGNVSAAAWRFHERLFDGLNLQARVIRARARQHEDVAFALSTSVAYRD